MERIELIKIAKQAMKAAYTLYSGFAVGVGAAMRTLSQLLLQSFSL